MNNNTHKQHAAGSRSRAHAAVHSSANDNARTRTQDSPTADLFGCSHSNASKENTSNNTRALARAIARARARAMTAAITPGFFLGGFGLQISKANGLFNNNLK